MADSNLAPEKSFVFDFVERNAKAVATIGDSVFYFGELGMQEVESAKLMTETGGAWYLRISHRILRYLWVWRAGDRPAHGV